VISDSLASAAVRGRDDPLIVDEISTAEMSAVVLERDHPRPAVRRGFHAADHTRVHARRYRRHAARLSACIPCIYYIRYDTRNYFNVRSKADISQLNLPHGTNN